MSAVMFPRPLPVWIEGEYDQGPGERAATALGLDGRKYDPHVLCIDVGRLVSIDARRVRFDTTPETVFVRS